MSNLDRRTFLRGVSASAAISVVGCNTSRHGENPSIQLPPTTEDAVGLGVEVANAPTMADGRPALRLITVEADGSPLDAQKLRTLHARDLNNDPLPQAIVTGAGRARIELNRDEPIQISLRLKVPGFGEVYCYADNDGRGYTQPGTIDFVLEAALTRIRRVRERFDALRPTGLPSDPTFNAHLAAAAQPIPKAPGSQQLAVAYEVLANGLHAGERLAMNHARHRIARFDKPRDDFKFGILAAQVGKKGPVYDQHLRDLFNFGTVAWYSWREEKFADTDPVDYARMDASIDWCLANKVTPKAFGYLYMIRGGTPDWVRPIETPSTAPTRLSSAPESPSTQINTLPNSEPSTVPRQYNPRWGYDRIKDLYHRVIRTTTARYHGRVEYIEVMNEAHDKANLWNMSHDQILDMAKMAFAAAREGSPTMKRQMNHCCMWGEYAKRANEDGTRRWSPFQFIKTCFDAGIDYEVIGLQLYYPQNDLFEIDRMLERFTVFNKKIHITELGTSSEDGLDPQSMRPKTYAPGWHGPWSPSIQADWTESVYTLCYSKPAFEKVGWWDFWDESGLFWPFGGLLDKKLQPKEAYLRIRSLQQAWGLAKPSAV